MAATRTHAAKRPAAGRFRGPGSPTHRPAARRTAAPAWRPALVTRRKPQKSGIAKILGGLGAALPGAGSRKAGRGGGMGKGRAAGGLAVLAGAAGLALKNRDRLQAMITRKGPDSDDRAPHPAAPPPTPVAVDERPAPAAGAADPLAPGTGAGEPLADRRQPVDPTDRPAP
jgi:hypothetical protein